MFPTKSSARNAVIVVPSCPPWCSAAHGEFAGEEDWIHESEPVALADGLLAGLRMSIDPFTGLEDGPYIVIGSQEYTVEVAGALGQSLSALAGICRTR